MKIFDTSTLDPASDDLSADDVYWIYNGLDCCLTSEIREVLSTQMDDVSRATYEQEMRMTAPILSMMLRGLKVSTAHRRELSAKAEANIKILERNFNRLCIEGVGLTEPLNWRSHMQVKHLLYQVLKLPVTRKRNAKGILIEDSSRATLEKLSAHHIAKPFISHLLALRDAGKKLGFLKTPLDKDGRMRCNFNIAGTNTGRLSSSFSDYGTGTNLQNVTAELRYAFVPDAGKVFINIDLEQADSRNVGALCYNLFYESHGPEFAGSYLDACESGDLHTLVCRMAWPDLDWVEGNYRATADLKAYREKSYRDLAKMLGHGTNYLGQAPTMSGHSKVPVDQIREFQKNYFAAFPCIQEWHKATIHTLETTGQLTNLFGRRRFFFNRLNEDKTHNAAIAYSPQGSTGDEINEGILRLSRDPRFELLVQVHDSILFQVDWHLLDELMPIALEALEVKIPLAGGREFFVPVDAMVGWNWGYASKSNPSGLAGWKGKETRRPPRTHAERLILSF